MCNYCGCREFAEIATLTEQHDLIVNEAGDLHRAVASGDPSAVSLVRESLSRNLGSHTVREEAGLFRELALVSDVAPHIAELCAEHALLDSMLVAIEAGAVGAYERFETKLRHHIDREENGLFPAAIIDLEPDAWERIDDVAALQHS